MREIGVVAADGIQVISMAALTAFDLANSELGEPGYRIRFMSVSGGEVPSSFGFPVVTEPLSRRMPDTVIVVGQVVRRPPAPAVLDYLRRARQEARRVASICNGAFVLAASGLLDGRLATTHWARVQALQEQFPAVRVTDERIYTEDDGIWTSAGMSAGIDLALALIEQDHGPRLAGAVARRMVLYHRRPGGQTQHSALLDIAPRSDRVQRVLAHVRENLSRPLGVEDLAEVARLSPRQFSRVFREETGMSPARAVERLRLEAAKTMMETGRHPLDVIARDSGFADRDRMRRAFLRVHGHAPRALAGQDRPAGSTPGRDVEGASGAR
ncbi:GlxA family transcriptional regulator [Oceanicella sp. SM1341]|uniref:GlxA family transcriptional regulator n=1 Tax=Oceanicella sp. SM1341 TaxID=1548889 RepID=UPI000E515D59|nr:GlxA family transcriptional regulator [Oceanicella sp. SM1341]